jgi:hypothetical protein
MSGVDPDDPSTWTSPVVRLMCPWTEPFACAGTQPVLCSTYDQLLGADRWKRRPGVGGTIPVRFPHPDDPGDAGWHIEVNVLEDFDMSEPPRCPVQHAIALALT